MAILHFNDFKGKEIINTSTQETKITGDKYASGMADEMVFKSFEAVEYSRRHRELSDIITVFVGSREFNSLTRSDTFMNKPLTTLYQLEKSANQFIKEDLPKKWRIASTKKNIDLFVDYIMKYCTTTDPMTYLKDFCLPLLMESDLNQYDKIINP